MQIATAYRKYKILPALQLHMYRVAAVASIICENSALELQTENIISACLLHDMGNIIKFKLGLLPDLLEPEGVGYWQQIKSEFKQKYGTEEHLATYQIADELGVSVRTLELIKSVGFSNAESNFNSGDLAKKICCYADQRVSPAGVTSLLDRINEGRARHTANKSQQLNIAEFERTASYLTGMEVQIFAQTKISPEEISNTLTDPLLQHLENFTLV